MIGMTGFSDRHETESLIGMTRIMQLMWTFPGSVTRGIMDIFPDAQKRISKYSSFAANDSCMRPMGCSDYRGYGCEHHQEQSENSTKKVVEIL